MNNRKEHRGPPLLIAQLGSVHRRLRRECEGIFRQQGFPLDLDQTPVLLHLYYGGPTSQQEICATLLRDKASVNRTVAYLTKNDIVTVTTDAADRRRTIVELTPVGEKLARKANSMIEKYDASLSAALTKEEREQFHALMYKLIATFKSAPLDFPI